MVSTQFEQFQPINRLAVALVLMVSVIERVAVAVSNVDDAKRTFTEWRDVVDYVRKRGSRFKSNGKQRYISEFLEEDSKLRIGLTGRNFEDSIGRLEDALDCVLEAYLSETGPLYLCCASHVRSESDENVVFLRKAYEVISELVHRRTFKQIVDEVSPSTFPGQIILRVTNELFGDCHLPPHPILKSLSIFDPRVLPAEFFLPIDLDVERETREVRETVRSYGLYAVIREARGWNADQERDVNLIVRDLLWIRRASCTKLGYAKSVDGESLQIAGFYVSVIDKACFIVTQISVDDKIISVSAKLRNVATRLQTMDIKYPIGIIDRALHIRDGQMSGVINESGGLGAWKCLLVRPDWYFCDYMRILFDRSIESEIDEIYNICAEACAVGVLFSKDLRDYEKKDIQGRREAFKSLIQSRRSSLLPDVRDGRDTLGEFISQEIRGVVRDSIRLADQMVAAMPSYTSDDRNKIIEDGVIDAINDVITAKQALIEPAQIVTNIGQRIAAGKDSPTPIDYRNVEILMGLNDVVQY